MTPGTDADLAREILTSTASMNENKALLGELVQQLALGLQNEAGVGPVTAALVLAAYSHHGRVRSEAAFAALAGAYPIPRPPETPHDTGSTATATGSCIAHSTSSREHG